MKKYNVLWIDDEAEKQEAFIELAALEGICLQPFTTNKAGIGELTSNVDVYDAVILDAKGFENSVDEKAGLSGLQESIKAINSLSSKKPYFIFSGYLDQQENQGVRDLLKNEEIYTKGKDNEFLFARIKECADQQLDTQIRHEFAPVFKALDSYGSENKSTALTILRAMKTGGNDLDDHLYFTPIRIILETMFRKANQYGLLHDKCVTVGGNKVNLTESSRFLAGLDTRHLGVRCTKAHFPKLIALNIQSILDITGAASHTAEVDINQNIDIQDYRATINTPFLLYQVLFKLADTLIWFEQYCKENNDIETNKSYWADIDFDERDIPWVHGVLTHISDNGWGIFTQRNSKTMVSIHKDVIASKSLEEGEELEILYNRCIAQKVERL